MSELTPLQQVVNLLQRSEKLLLLTHAKADGDGLSSILALALVLKKLGKKTTLASADPAAPVYEFLPAIETVDTEIAGAGDLVLTLPLGDRTAADVSHRTEDGVLKIFVRSKGAPFVREDVSYQAGEADYDLIITCDTPELPQLGRLFEIQPDLFYETAVVNIDHHASNTGFGRVNLVDVTAASTTELITRIVQALESEANTKLMDADIATLLLTGLTTDTGSFQNANTTPRALEVAANLIEAGARQQEIIHQIFKTKQLTTLKLWGRVLSKIQSDPVYRIVWSTITEADLAETGADEEESMGIIDELLTNAPGAEVVLLLKQSGANISGSLRTTTPAISAIEIAEIFGGGGHPRAAGFKIKGKQVEATVETVIQKIAAYQAKRLDLNLEDEAKPAAQTKGAETKLPKGAESLAAAIAAASKKEKVKSKKTVKKK